MDTSYWLKILIESCFPSSDCGLNQDNQMYSTFNIELGALLFLFFFT